MTSLIKSRSPQVWIVLGAIFLSLAWILPNHSQPWTTFHSDIWVGFVLVVAGAAISSVLRNGFAWHGLVLLTALTVPIPFLQFLAGQIPFAGQAWVVVVYLVGFFGALCIGQHWQRSSTGGPGDFLFFAFSLASLISVALQFQQWLGNLQDGSIDVWMAAAANGGRPNANMGQANQLATLLLWGVLGCSWGLLRKILSPALATILTVILLSGLALTQSRSGALGVFAIVFFVWYWKKVWGKSELSFPLWVTGLAALFGLMMLGMPTLSRYLEIQTPSSLAERTSGELRPQMWQLFGDAVLQQPWSGFGWRDVVAAQLSVAEKHSAIHHPSFQSHNIFLDFCLWLGLPLGLLLTFLVIAWVVTAMRRINQPTQVIYFGMLMVVGIHAMLELPLHYAYFLLPAGMVMGALNRELDIWRLKIPEAKGSWICLGVSGLGALLLGVMAHDYLKIEAGYASLQLERAGIVGGKSSQLPDVWVLNQLREAQRFAKFEPSANASEDQLAWAKNMVAIVPSARSFMAYATLLGLNGRGDEAKLWLIKMCRVVARHQCELGPARWANAQKDHPGLIDIAWPDEVDMKSIRAEEKIRESMDAKEK